MSRLSKFVIFSPAEGIQGLFPFDECFKKML